MQNQNKSKFLCFVFSLIPGAGQMYLGFMKTGLWLMFSFVGVILFFSVFHVAEFSLAFLPIIWLYSFFDVLNRRYCSYENFANLKDEVVLPFNTSLLKNSRLVSASRPIVGTLVALIGLNFLMGTVLDLMYGNILEWVYDILITVRNSSLQFLFAIAIIALGVRLIIGKKQELHEDNAAEIAAKLVSYNDDEEQKNA